MFKKLLTLLCGFVLAGSVSAQAIWSDVSANALPSAGERRIQPAKFRSVKLDLSAIKPLLAAAPERFSPAAESGNLPVISLPLPDGSVGRFQLVETPVMHPDLQAKFPQIRTYTGRGIDDPSAVLKCDLTPWGFHGMVHSRNKGVFFIDPAIHGNDEFYVVYNKKDYAAKKSDALWTCETPDPVGAQELIHGQGVAPAGQAEFQGDTKLRRYRLALACTGEYATFHGGTKPLVLAAMNTTMNRVNGVYEIDFAVTMQIIANNDLLIYLNGATDPYSNGNGSAMLGQNQTTCNNVIGTANYDIGHVFSTGGGGIAGLNVVCGTSKANGVTGQGSPIGDPFDIDYVAHEMGHQFGGSHTYGNCGGNVNNPAAVEPGSGTTIMAYAGICGAQNVDAHSEDFFHGYNIVQMGSFIYSGGANNCPVKITTTNHNPVVSAGIDRTIPKSTPFMLTATGSDIDGDTLTYTWEQMDFGNAPSPPVSTATVGPLFRSFKGTTSPTRFFPRLSDLVTNTNFLWEELPGVARTMNFRVVARDNDWLAGCTDEDDMIVTVSGNSGPFLVTAPNTNVQWFVGEQQIITWDVANTTAAPVSCANVRITLSTDGGFTYPIELAASVPNNGSAEITVPNNVSNTCRIRVESVGNIFFDISNINFRISLPLTPTFLLDISETNLNICAGETASFDASLTSIVGFNNLVDVSVSGAPAGATVEVSPNPVMPSGTATINISDLTPAMVGDYTLTVTCVGAAITQTATVALSVLPGALGATAILGPLSGETGVSTSASLTWESIPFVGSYLIEVATNPSFSAGSIVSAQTTSDTSFAIAGLAEETVYYWRVLPSNACGDGQYTATAAFQTGSPDCGYNFSSTDVPKTIPVAATVAPVVSTLTVPENRFINDVNISTSFTHTWPGDVLAWLISPTNDTILLFDQPGVPSDPFGCNGDNGNLTFDSQAAQTANALENQCNAAPPALNGTFQPIESLNNLIGKSAAGEWKFVMGDNYPTEDGGNITAWSLSFCFPQSILPGNILTNEPLDVLSSLSGTIFQSLLELEITGIQAQGIFILLSLPEHGTLELNGTPLGLGDTFTQEDINNNVLVYVNNGDGAPADDFHFDALDQNNNAWVHNAVFNINISPNDLAATAAETAGILCHGDATGEITATASGLDGNYTYSLNGGASQSSNVFGGLPAGTYTVVVTGQFGLTVAANSVTIDEPSAISVNASVLGNDITVTASGGTGVLEYSIDGVIFQASNQFDDVDNGTYTITVRDENGCLATEEVTVNVSPISATATVVTLLCFGDTDGSITIEATGGIPDYTYSLDGGAFQSSPTFDNLGAGFYNVTVKDLEGNEIILQNIVVSSPSQLFANVDVSGRDAMLSIFGGVSPYSFVSDAPNPDFQNLPNGTYQVTATDANGCTATTTFTVFVEGPFVSASISNVLCYGDSSGSIIAEGSAGVPPYQYSLDGVAFQSSDLFDNLSAGLYTLTVRDADGFEFTLIVLEVEEPELLTLAATVSGNEISASASGGTPFYQYSLNGGPPQSNGTFSNLVPGSYTVVATDFFGCTASVTNLVVTSGTVEPAEAWGLRVSPNPGNGLFVLAMKNAPAALRAEVFDATGRLLRSLDFQPTGGEFSTLLDLQDLPQANYFLRLSDGKNWGAVRLHKIGGK